MKNKTEKKPLKYKLIRGGIVGACIITIAAISNKINDDNYDFYDKTSTESNIDNDTTQDEELVNSSTSIDIIDEYEENTIPSEDINVYVDDTNTNTIINIDSISTNIEKVIETNNSGTHNTHPGAQISTPEAKPNESSTQISIPEPTTESKTTESTTEPTTESKTTESTTEPTTESKTTESTTEPTTESTTTESNDKYDEEIHHHSWSVVKTSYKSNNNGTHTIIKSEKCSCGKTIDVMESTNCNYDKENISYNYASDGKHLITTTKECKLCKYKNVSKKTENCNLTGTRVTAADGITVTVRCPVCSHNEVVHKHNLGEAEYSKSTNDCCIATITCKDTNCNYSTSVEVSHSWVASGIIDEYNEPGEEELYRCIHCGATKWGPLNISYNINDEKNKQKVLTKNSNDTKKFC